MKLLQDFSDKKTITFLRPLLVSFCLLLVFFSGVFVFSTRMQQSAVRDIFYAELGAKLSFIASELEQDILPYAEVTAANDKSASMQATLQQALTFAEIKCIKFKTPEEAYFAPPEAFCKRKADVQEIEISLPSIESELSVVIDENPLETALQENLRFNVFAASSLVLLMLIVFTLLFRKLHSKELQTSIDALEAKIYSSPLPILRTDSEGKIIDGNFAWEELTKSKNLQSRDVTEIVASNATVVLNEVLPTLVCDERMETYELKQVQLALPDFKKRFFNVSIKPAKIGGRIIYLLTFAEVTSLIVEREIIKRMLRTDELTGALTRRAMYEDFGNNQRSNDYAFILFDIDFFKSVNDFYGHSVGDRYLQALVYFVSENIGNNARLIRLGGEEFVIIEPCASVDELYAKSKKVQSCANSLKIDVDEMQVNRTISVGSILLTPNMEISKALSYADEALGKAKEAGRNRVFVNPYPSEESTTKIPRRAQLEQVRNGLDKGQFEIHFQPICKHADHSIVGFETLMRWKLNGKHIPPYLFIDEYYKVMNSLSLHRPRYDVFTKGLDKLKNTEKAWVSINVRVDDLLDGRVNSLLSEFQAYQKQFRVVLEISEELISDRINSVEIQEQIQSLKQAGFIIALDDFGKEGSNLQRLSSFPIDIVKLDKFFANDIEVNTKNQKLVQSLVTLGKGIGFELIAEGIETEVQANIFAKLGIPLHQGYHYSKPKSVSQLNRLRLHG